MTLTDEILQDIIDRLSPEERKQLLSQLGRQVEVDTITNPTQSTNTKPKIEPKTDDSKVYCCPICGSASYKKHGMTNQGMQRYICKDCGKTFSENYGDSLRYSNPPYNNDLYLDFVDLGFKISKQYTVMITPAKWQAKGGKKNDDFRQNIVPYMSKIVYHPVATDIFDIAEVDGISLFICDKTQHENKIIENISTTVKGFNSIRNREICHVLNNVSYEIMKNIEACSDMAPYHFMSSVSHWGFKAGENLVYLGSGIKIMSAGQIIAECGINDINKNVDDVKSINVVMNRMAGYCYFFDDTGKTVGINKMYILGKDYVAPFN